jgi:predicted transcriptional regulator
MPNRRSKFEIYIDILTQIKSGTNIPTRIMYSSNLSWKPLKQILNNLIKQGLIEDHQFDEGDKRTKNTYNITEKGDNVLRYFNRAKDLMEVEVRLRH